jgi:hypothetical protein
MDKLTSELQKAHEKDEAIREKVEAMRKSEQEKVVQIVEP